MLHRPDSPASRLLLQPRNARQLAYRVLEAHRSTGQWIQDELATQFQTGRWSSPDRRLVTELTNGVVRRQAALRALIEPLIARPWERIEPELISLLMLGTYQLVYLDRVPAFAALHETVEVARDIGQPRWTGFLNAILRKVSQNVLAEATDRPAVDAVPIGYGRHRQLSGAVFPSPEDAPAEYVAAAYSLPLWLVTRWHERYAWDSLLAIAEAVNQPPALYVRVNRRRTSAVQLQRLWAEQGVNSETAADADALRLIDAGAIEDLPGYQDGLFSPQDLTAMQAAQRLAPMPGERVWDVCAAPGTKTCHLAEVRDDHGEILATDVSEDRLAFVESGAIRLGLTSIRTQLISSRLDDLPRGPFDAILVDAPCSNTGVLHRRPEARWRIQPEDHIELSELQQRLLTAALARLSPGGRLLYSTCSIEPEENEAVVAAALGQVPGITLQAEYNHLPSPGGDGGYQALLSKADRSTIH